MMANDETSPRKVQTCPNCKAEVDRLAVVCPECDTSLPIMGGYRRSSRGRRYVYGKRKAHLSQEVVWLIVVIIIGLLIVFGVQVLAFMRSKKILMVPQARPQAVCRLVRAQPPVCHPEPKTKHLASISPPGRDDVLQSARLSPATHNSRRVPPLPNQPPRRSCFT